MTPRTASRIRRLALAMLILVVALGAANTIVTDRETRGAEADIGRLVEVDGERLQVRLDGDRRAPAIVLIHGLAGSLHLWDRLVPLLDDRHLVIRVDLLGHGGSDKPRRGYSPRAQADRLGVLLDALHVRRALVVGHSLGGIVAVALAERRPDVFRGLVAIGTPARSGDVDLPAIARLGTVPVMGELFHRVVSDGMVAGALGDALGEGVAVPRQFVDDYRAMTYSAYASSYKEADEFSRDEPLPERLAKTRVPLLAIMGDEDEEVKETALSAWKTVPGARTELLPGQGHTPQWQRPRGLLGPIGEFEAQLSRRPGARSRRS